MARKWPGNIEFEIKDIPFDSEWCSDCDSKLHYCPAAERRIYSLNAPLILRRKRAKCSNPLCIQSKHWFYPSAEKLIAMPKWKIGWDVFTWMGFRRFKRHWSVPQIQDELRDTNGIELSSDAIEDHLRRYRYMVAKRYQNFDNLQQVYKDTRRVILSIDGLQPEKGHETLYVVRDLVKNRVWFAEPLLSSSTEEVCRIFQRTKEWAQKIGVKVEGWMSDKQSALVQGVSREFPNATHAYCKNHFLLDLAKKMLEIDSHAKVQMRKKVRGLRTIERQVLTEVTQGELRKEAGDIVMDYCCIIRGILNDNHGGPFNPPGTRMYRALIEVKESIASNLRKRQGTEIQSKLDCILALIRAGCEIYEIDQPRICRWVQYVKKIANKLDCKNGPLNRRRKSYQALARRLSKDQDEIVHSMAKTMRSWEAGLFVYIRGMKLPDDNLDLERWFRQPKGHERRIHGRKHVGTRVVVEGASLMPALDAHLNLTKPFSAEELMPCSDAGPTASEISATSRRRTMSKACSKKKEKY